jgi:hypothetical protein
VTFTLTGQFFDAGLTATPKSASDPAVTSAQISDATNTQATLTLTVNRLPIPAGYYFDGYSWNSHATIDIQFQISGATWDNVLTLQIGTPIFRPMPVRC